MGRSDQGPLDRAMFEQVVAEYADRLYSIAVRITGSATDAEDAVQDAFLNAYRNLAQFRREASPSTWLYRIGVNAALTRVRQRRAEAYLDEITLPNAPVTDWSERATDPVLAAELRDRLEAALADLPVEYRTAVVLRDVEGLSTREAAAVLEINEAALKSRLHRGRVLMRQQLDAYLQS